jgi:dTDP-4-amino-4,6-dideoxygalactose transaminase
MESAMDPEVTARRRDFLPFSPPLIGEEEIAEVVDTLRSGWITTGPKTKRFEGEFVRAVQAPAALALNSGTAALHTALVCLGIGPGDEVVTSSLTFAATANVIEHVGARPVLVDVEPDTLNIDPAGVEAAITSRTKAIMPVHYAGHPADLDPIQALAETHGLQLVEDAAHALSASYKGRTIGSHGHPAAFSFQAVKNLTTGEGGMLTGPPELIERARILALHGMSRDAWNRYAKGGTWAYEIVLPGFKSNMTDIQASLGLHQLARLPWVQARRQEIVSAYQQGFGDCEALELPVKRPEVEHAWHLYVLRLRDGALRLDRDGFIEQLKAYNIGASVHYTPVHMHPYYRNKYGYAAEDLPVSCGAFRRMLSLPLSAKMTDADVADVIEAVRDLVRRFRA